ARCGPGGPVASAPCLPGAAPQKPGGTETASGTTTAFALVFSPVLCYGSGARQREEHSSLGRRKSSESSHISHTFLKAEVGSEVQENQTVRFGPYIFEPHNARLLRGRHVVPLRHKACEVLQYLVAHPGQVVTKEALFAAVWPEMAVSERVLTNCITELRQALGDAAQRPRFIATVHRRGGAVVPRRRPPPPPPAPP